jgi:hypothetical protein
LQPSVVAKSPLSSLKNGCFGKIFTECIFNIYPNIYLSCTYHIPCFLAFVVRWLMGYMIGICWVHIWGNIYCPFRLIAIGS